MLLPWQLIHNFYGQTDRQRHRQTERQTDQQTDRQTDRVTDRETARKTDSKIESAGGPSLRWLAFVAAIKIAHPNWNRLCRWLTKLLNNATTTATIKCTAKKPEKDACNTFANVLTGSKKASFSVRCLRWFLFFFFFCSEKLKSKNR